MKKQTRTPRRRALLFAGAAAAAIAWATAAPLAAAQEAGEQPAEGPREEAADAESTSASPSPEAPAPQVSREERLDQLLSALPASGPDEHEKLQEEIVRLWSRSGSDSMDLLLLRGRDALNEENTLRAIAHFSALVEHAPEFAEGWNARATAYYIHGEWGLSLADIEQTLRLEPRHFGALAGLGFILEQLGDKAQALAAFRAAAAIHPHLERVNDGIKRLAPEVDGRDI